MFFLSISFPDVPFSLQLGVLGREGVAVFDIAGVQSFLEPFGALGGGAVVEALGDGVAACLLLQVVVADFGGYVQSLLDVAVFQ